MTKKELFARYWQSASVFWLGHKAWKMWGIMTLIVTLILFQLYVQYLINYWNRDFFNALDKRDVALLWEVAKLFIPLAIASIAIAIISVWAKMTVQRSWRANLSKHLIQYWMKDEHYRHLKVMKKKQLNAEYRIAEDARVATDLPIDLLIGLITSVLTAITFIKILWSVGSSLDLNIFGTTIFIPGYLVISAIAYSSILTGSMIIVGRNLANAVEEKNHSEAEFRSAASRIREHGEGSGPTEREMEERRAVEVTLSQVILGWRNLCWELMKTTFVAHGNSLIAPIIGLLLCTPKYLSGGMSLGEVVQSAAAFVIVQSSFNWLLDNYPRIADWLSSANRVAYLLFALDNLEEN